MSSNMTPPISGEQINGTALDDAGNGTKGYKYNGELLDYLDHNNIRIVIMVSYLSTFLFGLLGNALVLYIISYFSKVRTKSVANYYIWNLSLADLLFCFALPFFAVATYTRHWPFGSVCCKLAYLLRDMNRFTSIFTLCALSIDRYIATFYHLAYLRTIQVGKFVCVAIWVISLIISTPYLIFANTDESGFGRERCGLIWPAHNKLLYMRFWTYFQLLLGLIGPTLMLTTSYGLLIRRFVFMMKQQHKNQIKKSGKRMTQTVIAIVVIFLICQTPYYVVQILSLQKAETAAAHKQQGIPYIPTDHEITTFVYVNALAQILVFFSSCSNPIIYALLNENFRKLYSIVLCRCHKGSRLTIEDFRDLEMDGQYIPVSLRIQVTFHLPCGGRATIGKGFNKPAINQRASLDVGTGVTAATSAGNDCIAMEPMEPIPSTSLNQDFAT